MNQRSGDPNKLYVRNYRNNWDGMEWDGGACEDRKGLFEEMIFELKLKG